VGGDRAVTEQDRRDGPFTPDFLGYLHLYALYGWSRAQVDAMPPEKIERLLSLEDHGESE
jgi:hypothetical protein